MSGVLRRIGLLLCLAVLVGAIPALAQTRDGEIFGKVTDESGGVLPGVNVTVSGAALIQPLTAITSESGAYRFPKIPIGTYTVTFSGAEVEQMFYFGPLPGSPVMSVLCSYAGRCFIGITYDGQVFADGDLLRACMQEGLDEILALNPHTAGSKAYAQA